MSRFQKIFVVDDGARTPDHALSMELAELGFASVTASLDATDAVLELIPAPAAIMLQLPNRGDLAPYRRFMELADRLKTGDRTSKIPVILATGLPVCSRAGTRRCCRPKSGPERYIRRSADGVGPPPPPKRV